MALVTLMSLLDDTILVQLDVSAAGAVVGVAASNGSNRTATVTLTRPSGSIASRTLAPGANVSVSIPKGKQFPYADDVLSDWQLGLSLA